MSMMRELPPRSEPLPAFSTGSVYVKFTESDSRDMLACELITKRYQGIEAPLMTFSRDGVKTLVCPPTIVPVFFKRKGDDAKQVSGEAPTVHGLPNGTGAING